MLFLPETGLYVSLSSSRTPSQSHPVIRLHGSPPSIYSITTSFASSTSKSLTPQIETKNLRKNLKEGPLKGGIILNQDYSVFCHTNFFSISSLTISSYTSFNASGAATGMSTLLWATPLRRSHHFHARSPWRTSSLRAPVSIFKRRFEDFCARGIYRLGNTKLCGSFHAAVRGLQKAGMKTNVAELDEAPRDGLLAFYADHFVVPLPEGHRFPMTKYRATRSLLEGDEQLRDILVTMPASMASIDDVCLVHDEGYVQRFISGGLTEKEQRAVGFPWSVEHRQRSLASTGGTVAAMHTVMQDKRQVAANIAGGRTTLLRVMERGFVSVFNDIAVASATCLRDYPANCNLQNPILVVDLDVHQGNGTSKLFENDDRVITFDMHGAGNYPWKTKTKSNYDIGLPDGTEDEDYLATLAEWLPHLIELHEPGLVFFQAGVDALKEDSFGRLAMTRQGLLKRNNMVYSACIERNLPLVITMGGGYSRPSDASIEAHADVYRSAALRYSALRGKAEVPFRVSK